VLNVINNDDVLTAKHVVNVPSDHATYHASAAGNNDHFGIPNLNAILIMTNIINVSLFLSLLAKGFGASGC
jgi:hypothetical protein